jgi:hypothetical protein
VAPNEKCAAKTPDGNVARPPVFLLNCAGDFIRVKHYSPRTEQANFDRIKRFIDFHGKRHPPEVTPTYGAWAEYLIDRPGLDKHRSTTAMGRSALRLQLAEAV